MDYQLITDADVQEYYRFCLHHAQHLGRVLPDELWHYTDANGLIGILQSGKIWTTQVTCLNDTLEQRYFGDLVHAAVKQRRTVNTDPAIEPLFRVADNLLSERDFTAMGQFVACFSEAKDDLGQWRGYGGGECGFAIGFSSQGIMRANSRRVNTLLMPMIYADSIHSFVVADVIRMSETYYRQGLSRGDHDLWAREFVIAFSDALSITAANVKHPKFSGEAERRIVTLLQPDEHQQLEFRQKRTLLARHLPIDITSEGSDAKRLLPITRIVVGPGPAQKVTKVSVGDLLLKFRYQKIEVELSNIPYRLP
jgi:hypothetical protein